jgi:hypothetical protein
MDRFVDLSEYDRFSPEENPDLLYMFNDIDELSSQYGITGYEFGEVDDYTCFFVLCI